MHNHPYYILPSLHCRHLFRYCAIPLLILTSACSTIVEGRTQQIMVNTTPEGASCVLKSNDAVLGTISATPGSVRVEKTKNDIVVECTKDGYIKSKIKNHSDYAAASLGNMIFGQWSFVGNMVDAATGANNKYDGRMLVALDKDDDIKIARQSVQEPPRAIQQSSTQLPRQAVIQEVEEEQAVVQQAVPENTAAPIQLAYASQPPVLDVTRLAALEQVQTVDEQSPPPVSVRRSLFDMTE